MIKKKIAIVGGGITGLYLGYRLAPQYQVTIFEKNQKIGGLLGSFCLSDQSWPVDNFYHHFFSSDQKLISLLKELSLPYFFKKPITAIWQNNKINSFSSPKDLITFPKLGLSQKLRLGTIIVLLKAIPDYRLIPNTQAIRIFPFLMGKSAYRIIWEPLMRGKFGHFHKKISAVWLWGRIKKRSTYLGYPKGGFAKLTEKLTQKIITSGGQIRTNQPIAKMSQLDNFDQVIFTTPKKVLDQIVLNKDCSKKNIPYLASLNLILSGPKPILKNSIYWLNIADSTFPFVAIVNQSGLVDRQHYNNNYLTYIGGYYQQKDPLLNLSANKILTKFTPFIKKINPRFRAENYQVYLSKHLSSQPIVAPSYQKNLPPFKKKYKNIYLVSMEQIYPWDRGINYAIDLADKFLKSVALND